MKIGIVLVDSLFPNLALMKISSYYKKQGDLVEIIAPLFSDYDRIYASKIFNFTDDYQYFANFPNAEIIKGGSGYNVSTKLPLEIEDIKKPDYSLYPNCNYSLQFFSRGCLKERICPFCIVKQKEGPIHAVEPLELNEKGKHIEVLDNNFFGNPEWKTAAEQLIKWGQPVNLHGVDVRIMTEEHAYYLNKMKHYKQIHIAWDDPQINLVPKLQEVLTKIKPHKLMCYVLIGYWSTPEQDLYRVEKLRELKVDPFVMPFDKTDEYQRNFARWVNHKAIFKSVKWEDYRRSA
jgi:hypothetical protein